MASSAAETRRVAVTEFKEEQPGGLAATLLAHRPQLLRFFTGRTGDPAEAEDVVQEIWLRIAQAESGPIADSLSYLYRVGLNIVIDRVRERQRRERREHDWTDMSVTRLGGEAVDERPSAFAGVESRQRARQLAAAIEALPAGARRVFRRHKLDGLSHAQVAAELGITKSAVEKHIAVALRHLTAALKE
jgi:RNA polymerase sigma-70 factor (ECF subfamily)